MSHSHGNLAGSCPCFLWCGPTEEPGSLGQGCALPPEQQRHSESSRNSLTGQTSTTKPWTEFWLKFTLLSRRDLGSWQSFKWIMNDKWCGRQMRIYTYRGDDLKCRSVISNNQSLRTTVPVFASSNLHLIIIQRTLERKMHFESMVIVVLLELHQWEPWMGVICACPVPWHQLLRLISRLSRWRK
jgi:hypothetical protein